MKQIFLYKSNGKSKKSVILTDVYAMVDEDDFEYLSQHKWYLMKLYHCDTEILYARRYEGSPKMGNHKAILMHRVILKLSDRSQKADHKDGNGLNNQKANLRVSTHSENMSNRKVSYKKTIKYLGVYKNKDTYIAALKNNGVVYRINGLKTPELAALAYNDLVIKYKPQFGRLNVI